jgi:hypothetical protein
VVQSRDGRPGGRLGGAVMSGYPTPEAWRQHAAHAHQMAFDYLAAGNTVKADQRNDDAEFYESRAYLEEIRRARLNIMEKAA